MFKRVTWLGVGLVAGFGASKWVEHKARQRLARLIPGGLRTLKAGAEVRDLATGTLADLRYAVGEGRRAMTDREGELRRQLRQPRPTAVTVRPQLPATSNGGLRSELPTTRTSPGQAGHPHRRY
jgi:hypothetical protein